MAETKTYTLKHPIKALNEGGDDITEIVFHKPNLKELRKHDVHDKHGEYEKTARLLAAGSSLPMKILEGLEWEDLQAINVVVMDFLEVSED